MSDKAVADGPTMHLGRSARMLKMNYTEPITFGVFVTMTGRSVRLVSDGTRFSIGRSVVLTCVFAVFLSEAHPDVTDGLPQGPGRSAHVFFQKASPVRNNLWYFGQST
jgi:hypothetical protein